MKLNKFIILISIALIATLIMIIIVREDQHNEATLEHLDRENKQEDELIQSIKNFTELEEMYLELKQENKELKEANREISEWQDFVCTGYSDNDGEQGTNGITAAGFKTDCGLPIIAIDPKIIKPYSIVEIEGLGGFVALDVGGTIKGNRIDILFSSKQEAIDFGIQEREVRIIK